MRRFFVSIVLLAMLCGLAVSAQAVTAAKSVNSFATVSNDGSCQVTLTANIHLDQPVGNLRFPLPKKAGNITVNGARARSRVEGDVRQVDVSSIVGKVAGDFTLTFTYSLPDLITTNEAGLLELRLPLLAGFAYPVQSLEFSITLPGQVNAKPAFSSGYHQANIEKDIHCTTVGATITGIAQTELKDHETLTMILLVSEEMFPQPRIVAPDFKTIDTLVVVFSVVALLYWALTLRNLPSWPTPQPVAPDGHNAGEMGSVLCLQGGNLNMMVFSWAQLGYLQIAMEPGGRVRLYRQMDMGNERSSYEQRCFKLLFGRRDMVDATTDRYGELYHNVGKMLPNLSSLVHPKSGNLLVFRVLAALAGMFGGISVAVNLSAGAALQWLLIIALGALALWSCWYIQSWAVNLFVPNRRILWLGLGLGGLWLLVSALSGVFSAGLSMVAGQLFFGLLAALGGRRTLAGRQAMGEVLGLRRYLKTVSPEQLRLICQNNPEYFHQMMPYAMALGVDEQFAKRFGKLPIGPCPYIDMGAESTMRAVQWRSVMHRVMGAMNIQNPNSRGRQILALIRAFIK